MPVGLGGEIMWFSATNNPDGTNQGSYTGGDVDLDNNGGSIGDLDGTNDSFKLRVDGYREINNDYEIIQNEKFLFLNVKLNSKTLYDEDKNQTVLDDTFTIKLPIIFFPFKGIFKIAIIKHIKSQFQEDEIYRKRIHELRKRGIHKKYIFLAK